ncbi:MAG: DNA methyltransferase, partial [Psychrilyobacter sp.]|uniref:DNA methyltransferase n=1 Tax=Psychrilyobacter sp. TaxID=2586924 RepID=UPI003C77E3D9
RLILNNTKPGDLVVDWFGGSGSTLMSCDQIDRTAYLMEFDPKYVDVEVKRYAMAKEDVKLIRDGQEYSWDEVKENFQE